MTSSQDAVISRADWLLATMTPEHPALKALRLETDQEDHASMATDPVQGQILSMLVRMSGARRVLEVGTFKGYGALAMALALPADGTLLTLDVNEDWGEIGRKHWRDAGVADKISQKIGMAKDSLHALLGMEPRPVFDFVYVDADKKSYLDYVDLVFPMLRPGGIMALDNVFWGDSVLDPANTTKQAVNLRRLCGSLGQDPKWSSFCIMPVADGLGLAIKADDGGQ